MDYIGWLAPDGTLIECKDHAHLDEARNILKHFDIVNDDGRPDQVLIDKGWIRISLMTYGDTGLTFWGTTHITPLQRMMLETIANQEKEVFSKKGLQFLKDCNIYEWLRKEEEK